MKRSQPRIRAHRGGRDEPRRFTSEAAEMRANPLTWYDLEVPEQGRRLYDLIYNLRSGRYTALRPGEFEFVIDDSRLHARYNMAT